MSGKAKEDGEQRRILYKRFGARCVVFGGSIRVRVIGDGAKGYSCDYSQRSSSQVLTGPA